MNRRIFTIFFVLLFIASPSLASSVRAKYESARKAAKRGDMDFAFMHFNAIMRDHSNTKYKKNSIFALGEYHYSLNRLKEASQMFEQFVKSYPDDKGKLFALAYLSRIAKERGKEELAKSYEKDIITLKQVSLVFRKYKQYKFKSPLYKQYLANFHIDKIDVYVEGDLIVEISF